MSENKPIQPGDDPLAHLHRMSTTAGAASQEYVAINLIAVATLVLGLASSLVLLSGVLLVVPLLALICGVLALMQIRHSNGTQSGRALAVLGMLIAVAFGTFIGVRTYNEHQATMAEQAGIEQMLGAFEQKLTSKDYAGALPMFTDGFLEKKRITAAQFAQTWAASTDSPLYGAIKSVGISRLVLAAPGETGDRAAGSMLIISFEKAPQPLRREILFKKVGGQWKIDDIPQIFPPPPPPQPTNPGAPGTGMMPQM